MKPENSNIIDTLVELIKCSIWLEELTASLYEQISSKIEDPLTSSLMLVVSKQSRAHAEVMRSLGAALGYCDLDERINQERCIDLTGDPGRATVELIKKLYKVKEIDTTFYKGIIKELEYLETGIGEETYTRILLPLFKTALSSEEILERCPSTIAYGSSTIRELAVKLLDSVIEEEEELHEYIIRKSLELLERGETSR